MPMLSGIMGGGDGSVSGVVPAGSISLAEMADLATDRLMGRDTAGTGAPEALTVSGGIEFTGSGGIQTSAFTGDVTKAAGGTAQTLALSAANMAARAVANGNGSLYIPNEYVAGRFYLTMPIGMVITAANTIPLVDDVAYAVLQYAHAPITIHSVGARTSTTNASSGANVKIAVYAADGANGGPGTRLGLKTAATAVGDAATSTDINAVLDGDIAVPAGPYYIAILQDSTTGVRFQINSNASQMAGELGSTTQTGLYGGTAILYGYTMTRTYADGLPATFVADGTIVSSTLAPAFCVEAI